MRNAYGVSNCVISCVLAGLVDALVEREQPSVERVKSIALAKTADHAQWPPFLIQRGLRRPQVQTMSAVTL